MKDKTNQELVEAVRERIAQAAQDFYDLQVTLPADFSQAHRDLTELAERLRIVEAEHPDTMAGVVALIARAKAAESLNAELVEALGPFAERWDFAALGYVADFVDGKEVRAIPNAVVTELVKQQRIARTALDKRQKKESKKHA